MAHVLESPCIQEEGRDEVDTDGSGEGGDIGEETLEREVRDVRVTRGGDGDCTALEVDRNSMGGCVAFHVAGVVAFHSLPDS